MKTVLMISEIIVDPSLQTRSRSNEGIVQEYSAALMDGAIFPPVAVFDDGVKKYLADGFHRIAASVRVGRDHIDAVVHYGGKQAAFMYSLLANAEHGLRRTHDDKRYAVKRLLDEIEYAEASDREIALLCAVSHPFVAKIRAELGKSTCANKGTPKSKTHHWTRDRTKDVETLPPQQIDEYDQSSEIMQEMAQEVESLTDRLSIKAMDATDEERAMAFETIQSLRDEVKKLTLNLESMTISRNRFQNEAAEAIRQCKNNMHVIKKLNKQILQLQSKLGITPAEADPLPF